VPVRRYGRATSINSDEQPWMADAPARQPTRLTEQDIIEKILKDGKYDWRVRPRGYNDSWPGEDSE
jgi:hypothetical protein